MIVVHSAHPFPQEIVMASSSAATLKNQAVLALLLNKAEPGKRATVRNIASNITQTMFADFRKQTAEQTSLALITTGNDVKLPAHRHGSCLG